MQPVGRSVERVVADLDAGDGGQRRVRARRRWAAPRAQGALAHASAAPRDGQAPAIPRSMRAAPADCDTAERHDCDIVDAHHPCSPSTACCREVDRAADEIVAVHGGSRPDSDRQPAGRGVRGLRALPRRPPDAPRVRGRVHRRRGTPRAHRPASARERRRHAARRRRAGRPPQRPHRRRAGRRRLDGRSVRRRSCATAGSSAAASAT